MRKNSNLIKNSTKLNFCLALEIISSYLGLNRNDIYSKNRKQEVVFSRYMMYALMDEIEESNIDVATLVNKDHSSITHGLVEHIELYSQNYKNYKNLFDPIRREFLFRSKKSDEQFQKLQDQSFYELIQEMDKLEELVIKIKQNLLDSYLRGDDLRDEVSERINSIFCNTTKTNLYGTKNQSIINQSVQHG
jgi:hypothetical protein